MVNVVISSKSSVVSMLFDVEYHLCRWPNIKPTLGQLIVLALHVSLSSKR